MTVFATSARGWSRRSWLACSLSAWGFATSPGAAAESLVLRDLGDEWQGLPLRGRAFYRFWGLEIYEASLWLPTQAGLAWSSHNLVLSLLYRRHFAAQDIAERSVQEMQLQGSLAPNVARQWQRQLAEVLTDVRPGERLTAAYVPQRGVRFWHHARDVTPLGQLEDVTLASKFIGIWLAPSTSAPALRQALLGLPS